MTKIKNELKTKLSANVFNKKFVYIYTNEQADNLIYKANWDFIGNILDEFSVLIEDYSIEDVMDIYKSTYYNELCGKGACIDSTELALSLLGNCLSETFSI